MASAPRDRTQQAELPLILNGPTRRRLFLRILFVHGNAGTVESCLEELRRTHFRINADVVLALGECSKRLKSKYYDVVLAEYPGSNQQGPELLNLLRLRDRKIPCIFLTDTPQPETLAKLFTEGAPNWLGRDHTGTLRAVFRASPT